MNKEKYLNKVKKLLNLARKSSNPNEAAAALRQAQNLMAEHRISQDDVDFMDINEASSKGAPNHAEKVPAYMSLLAQSVARAFGVAFFFTWRYTGYLGVPKRIVTFYGPDSRPQVSAYAFDVLSRQMVAARKAFLAGMHKNSKPATKTTRADHFCEGWAVAVYNIIQEYGISEAEQTLIQAYHEKLGLDTSAPRMAQKEKRPSNARAAGYLAGSNAQFSQGIAGETASPALIGRS